jgi:6-phosphogluconolactonase
MEVITGPPLDLAAIFADRLSKAVRNAASREGTCSLVVPGGSVARAFFPVMAEYPLDWSRVEMFWGDERSVPPDDPESNFGIARELLLDRVPMSPSLVHRMVADGPDLEEAARLYETELRASLGREPRFDVVLLGVGADGHVCSLFPGHPALDDDVRLVTIVTDSPRPPPRRMTLTLKALADASLVCIAAFGAAKGPVVRETLNEPRSPLPAVRVARAAASTLFLLDGEAAGYVRSTRS